MGWSEVSTQAIDVKKSKGAEYEGHYTGKREINTKIGPQVIWEFENDSGSFGIYGFTNLNMAMNAVKEGTLVKIKYLGTKNVQTKFGMRDVHQVSVCKWSDDGAQPDEPADFDTSKF